MVVGTGRHRPVGVEEKGGRGSVGFGGGFGFRRRGVEWSKWVEWSGVEWGGRVNLLILTTGCNCVRGGKVAN